MRSLDTAGLDPAGERSDGVTSSVEPETPAHPARTWPRRATLIDLGLLTLFWLLSFWGVLVTRRYLIPYDLLDQHYMFQSFIHRALASGQSPTWAPEILGGYPIAADPLAALFYPPNLLMHLLAPGDRLPYLWLEWQAALHVLWAAAGAYLLGRGLTGSRRGGLLAAMVLAFGSFFAWHTPHLSPLSALSWLPWILLAYRDLIRTRRARSAALASLFVGLMALAGHALTIVQIGYLLVGLTVVVVARDWGEDRRRAAEMGVLGLIPLVLGAGLASVQLAPSWVLSGQTERVALGFAAATGASFQPQLVLTLLVPNFYSYAGPAPYWGPGDIAETSGYVGLLPLFLAALGVARARPGERWLAGALVAGGLIAAVLAFGPQTWAYRLAFDLLPGLDRVRRPVNFLVLLQLALGLLAALGLASLERDRDGEGLRRLSRWLRGGLALALLLTLPAAGGLVASSGSARQQVVSAVANGIVVAGVLLLVALLITQSRLRWHLSTSLALSGLVLLVAFDLGSANAGKVWQGFRRGPESYIGSDWAGSPVDPTVRQVQADLRTPLGPDRVLPLNAGSIWLNGPLVWGIASAQGYSVLWPTYYQEYLDAATANPNSPLLSLLGVRDIVTTAPLAQALPGVQPAAYPLAHDGATKVYRAPGPLPRVWFATRAVQLAPEAELPYLLAHPEAAREAITVIEPPPAADGQPTTTDASVALIAEGNSWARLHVDAPTAGFVVLNDIDFPGWTATVDGTPAPIYRADHAFRAVWVTPGSHDLTLRFALPGLRLGVAAALASSLAIVALAGVPVVAERRRRLRPGAA